MACQVPIGALAHSARRRSTLLILLGAPSTNTRPASQLCGNNGNRQMGAGRARAPIQRRRAIAYIMAGGALPLEARRPGSSSAIPFGVQPPGAYLTESKAKVDTGTKRRYGTQACQRRWRALSKLASSRL